MRDRLTEALKVQDVDYADIRIEDKTKSEVLFRGPDLDRIGSSRVSGGAEKSKLLPDATSGRRWIACVKRG